MGGRKLIIDPTVIDPTVMGWFEAGSVSCDSAGNIASVQDLSGAGATLVQATAAQRVSWVPNDVLLGGRPTLSTLTPASTSIGSGANLIYTTRSGVSLNTGAMTLYFVCYFGPTTVNALMVNAGTMLIFTPSGNTQIAARPGASATVNVNTLVGCIICWQPAATGGTSNLYVNNTQVPGTIAGSTSSYTTFPVMSNTGTNPGNCVLGAFGAFGSSHSLGQRQVITNALSKYYSIPLVGVGS